jgi:hypothetical protein
MADWATVLVFFGAIVVVAAVFGAACEKWLLRGDPGLPDAFTAAERARYAAKQDLWGETADGEPTEDEIYNGYGREGGIGYDTTYDEPGSLGEHDYRL